MKVFERLSSLLGRPKPPVSNGGAALRPERPVEIDISEDAELDPMGESGSGDFRALAAPRNKQELIAELQRNYAEVLELVRKVDLHLDTQQQRSARLVEIAERIPEAVTALSDIRAQNSEFLVAVRELTETSRQGDERVEAAVNRLGEVGDRQIQSIAGIGEHLEASARTEQELVGAVREFHGTLGEMTESSSRVGETLENMHRSAETREQELIDLLVASRRSSMLAIVFCGLVAVVAVVIAVIAMVN